MLEAGGIMDHAVGGFRVGHGLSMLGETEESVLCSIREVLAVYL